MARLIAKVSDRSNWVRHRRTRLVGAVAIPVVAVQRQKNILCAIPHKKKHANNVVPSRDSEIVIRVETSDRPAGVRGRASRHPETRFARGRA
jgi:hypothetical protein